MANRLSPTSTLMMCWRLSSSWSDSQTIGYDVFNVGTNDSLTVRDVADIVVERMGLANVRYDFTGGARGWKADVPVYKLDSRKIRSHGWSSQRNSREAVTAAVDSMLQDLKAGNIKPEA